MSHLTRPNARQKRDTQIPLGGRLYAHLRTMGRVIPTTVVRRIKLAVQHANQVNTLSQLSDHQLKDIGLTRDELNHHLNRGFFDMPPSHRSNVEYQHFGSRDSIYPVIRRQK